MVRTHLSKCVIVQVLALRFAPIVLVCLDHHHAAGGVFRAAVLVQVSFVQLFGALLELPTSHTVAT